MIVGGTTVASSSKKAHKTYLRMVYTVQLTGFVIIESSKKKKFDTIILTHVHIYAQIYNYTHFYIKIDQNLGKYLW